MKLTGRKRRNVSTTVLPSQIQVTEWQHRRIDFTEDGKELVSTPKNRSEALASLDCSHLSPKTGPHRTPQGMEATLGLRKLP